MTAAWWQWQRVVTRRKEWRVAGHGGWRSSALCGRYFCLPAVVVNTLAVRTRCSSKRKMSEKEKKRRRRGGHGDNVSGGWHVIWREVTSRRNPGDNPGCSNPGYRTLLHVACFFSLLEDARKSVFAQQEGLRANLI